jgi:hypothetical protein
MVHTLLIAALVLFVLWAVGLTGAWAANVAWVLFVIACAFLVAWAIVAFSTGGFGRRRMV